MEDKRIFVLPGATQEELERFAEKLRKEEGPVAINIPVNVYVVRDGDLFAVVSTLEKVKRE